MKPVPAQRIEEIFQQYKDKVYRLAISITHNDSDAQDILQNTFIKIIGNLKNFRGESKISTWIYKIAYNESLMFLRKKRNQFKAFGKVKRDMRKLPTGLFINWSKLPDEELLNKEFKERLDDSIRALPIKYRMPLLLHNVEGLSIGETAKILDIKENSLKTRIHRSALMINYEIDNYLKDKQEREKEKENTRCAAWTGFVYDFTRGILSKRRQDSFKKHIADCKSCRGFIDTYAKAVSITRALQCNDIPAELQGKIQSFLAAHKY